MIYSDIRLMRLRAIAKLVVSAPLMLWLIITMGILQLLDGLQQPGGQTDA